MTKPIAADTSGTSIVHSWRRQQVLTVFAFAIAAILLTAQHWIVGRAESIESARVQATMIGDSASAALVFDEVSTARDVVGSALRYPNIEAVTIYRNNGSVIAALDRKSKPPEPRIAPITQAAYRLGPRTLEVDAPVMMDDRLVGAVRTRVSRSGFYNMQLQFIGGLVVIVVLTVSAYFYTSAYLRKRVAGAEDALRHLALHDQVTQLPNRHAFEALMEQTLQRHRRDGGQSALLYIDVDDFKKVNDLFGHQVGDAALRHIAEKFRGALRRSDSVARMGGDEFGAILRDIAHPDDAARSARHLIELMAQPLAIDGHQVHLGLSIGIALIPPDGADVRDTQRHADMAMYRAKKEGKSTFCFFSEHIGNEVSARHDIDLQLRSAIAGEQFHIDYQPQVDSRDASICGVEALLRWRHPQRGLISPAIFIPIAEESDLILDIGDWVLNRVLSDIREMDARGLSLPLVAINISARQFVRRDMAAAIRQRLAAAGLGPNRLEIELTEGVLMEHSGHAFTTFDAIRASGLQLAIDDFGTGYSSLAYLKRLPVSKLKIDRAFVINLTEKEEDRAIARAIVHLADALGLRVVAEGVETQEQAAILNRMGCHVFQGYLTGRPAPLEQLLAQLPVPA